MQRHSPVNSTHVHEVRPRSNKRGFDLISDAVPFGRLWYGAPDAINNAIGYAKSFFQPVTPHDHSRL
jgi:hypothetical protein